MYHPTTRVLAILELLQSYPRLSGPELAARLEVDVRTVRRYIEMLQDLGIPIEAEPGRYGGYMLRAGFRLPPLMFTNDEIVVLTLGLLNARSLGVAETAPAVESALAKIGRVLPVPVAQQLAALQNELTVSGRLPDTSVDSPVLATLSLATAFSRPVRLVYNTRGKTSERIFEPYGVVHVTDRWYTAGYCHLREAIRVFRLDKVQEVEAVAGSFVRPAGFDCLAYILESIANIHDRWEIEVFLQMSIPEIRLKMHPGMAVLTPAEGGTIFRAELAELDMVARFLVSLGCKFKITQPPELRAALRSLAEEIVASSQ